MADWYFEVHRCNCGPGGLRNYETGYILIRGPVRDEAMRLGSGPIEECGMRKKRIWTRRRLVERDYGEARMRESEIGEAYGARSQAY